MVFESPKSSFTEESPLLLGSVEDSEDDLPRYSHLVVRAKPCCGRPSVALLDDGPKFYKEAVSSQSSLQAGMNGEGSSRVDIPEKPAESHP